MQFDCPNEVRKRLNCILCGQDDHLSFDCTQTLCFKCNKRGHQAKDCREQNIVKCFKCGHVGHKDYRCLKQATTLLDSHLKHMRCMECNKYGHVKCTKEAESLQIKISARVKNDLDEFVSEKFKEAFSDSSSANNAFEYVYNAQKSKSKKKKKLALSK